MSNELKKITKRTTYILCLFLATTAASLGAEDSNLDSYDTTGSVFFRGGSKEYISTDDQFLEGNPHEKKRRKKETVEDDEVAVAPLAGGTAVADVEAIFSLSRTLGVTPEDAATIQLLNGIHYLDERYDSPREIDLRKQTPTKKQKIDFLRDRGMSSPNIRSKMHLFKKENPHPIRDVTNYPRRDDYPGSPSTRQVMSRLGIKEARQQLYIIPIPPLAYVEHVEPETPTERETRKARQKAEFKAQFEAKETARLNESFGQMAEEGVAAVTKHHQDEMTEALSHFKEYFEYLEAKKARYIAYLEAKKAFGKKRTKGAKLMKEEKMRWPDAVGAFNQYVAPLMTRVEVEGYEVYFSLKTLDFNRIHMGTGLKNYEAMRLGSTPTGADGSAMNFHHVTQLDLHVHDVKIDEDAKDAQEGPFKLVLIPYFLHSEYSGCLHFDGATYVLPRAEIDRAAFGRSRIQINKKLVELFYKG